MFRRSCSSVVLFTTSLYRRRSRDSVFGPNAEQPAMRSTAIRAAAPRIVLGANLVMASPSERAHDAEHVTRVGSQLEVPADREPAHDAIAIDHDRRRARNVLPV